MNYCISRCCKVSLLVVHRIDFHSWEPLKEHLTYRLPHQHSCRHHRSASARRARYRKARGHNPSSKASRSSGMLWLLLWQLVFPVVSVAGTFPGWSLFYSMYVFRLQDFHASGLNIFDFGCGVHYVVPIFENLNDEFFLPMKPGRVDSTNSWNSRAAMTGLNVLEFCRFVGISIVEGSPFDPVICLGQTGQKN